MDSLIRLINVQVPEGINIVAPIYRKYMQGLDIITFDICEK